MQHSPYCRTIRLVAGPQAFIARQELFEYMPQFVEAFQKFQSVLLKPRREKILRAVLHIGIRKHYKHYIY